MQPKTRIEGKESVWEYPRPPRLEPSIRHVIVAFAGVIIADSRRAVRVLETSHPPAWYIPPSDVRRDYLVPSEVRSVCEFKGTAAYWSARVGDRVSTNAAWSYPLPNPPYASIRGYLAFYPSRVDACLVDGERALPQPGDFYGGWITSDLIGPFKGGPGTQRW